MSFGLEPGTSRKQVLVVDDEPAMRTALEVSFGRRGWHVGSASGKREALLRLRQSEYSLVVTDMRMPDGSGFEVMKAARDTSPQTAIILLTAYASVPDAVSAMKSGACEYLVKPVRLEQLLEMAEQVVGSSPAEQGSGLIGSSPAFLRTLRVARQAASTDSDILIEAESGTGKELLARMIHAQSARRERPFIAINCAGIPESLLESELFGHGRGAFTGAIAAQPGKFQLAEGGTLLLDEIGELPLSLQPKLLRALQEREFYRLGEAQPVKVNIRVIATTNRSLNAMVRDGSFRADLYFRLNVIPLTLPPLRDRGDDVRELALHFARMYAPDGRFPAFGEQFLSQLQSHAWPGNVRELANTMRRAVSLGQMENPVDSQAPLLTPAEDREDAFAGLRPGMSMQAAERHLLEMTLAATGGNRSRAAEMLGVSLRTVRNKIREYKLPPRRTYAHAHD